MTTKPDKIVDRNGLLCLKLLGSPEVTLAGRSISTKVLQKSLLLLIFLATESNKAHNRSYLAELLWPDLPQSQSFNNLRQAVFHLRQTLVVAARSVSFLVVGRTTLRFDPNSHYWLDISLLSEHPEKCDRLHDLQQCPRCRSHIALAFSHIRGPVLEGIDLRDCEEFQNWVFSIRERCRMFYLRMIDPLLLYLEKSEKVAEAVAVATRFSMLDPLDEAAQRRLIRLLWVNDEKEAALLQFENFSRHLQDQLDMSPEQETLDLIKLVRSGSGDREPRQQVLEGPLSYPEPLLVRRSSTVLFVDVFPGTGSGDSYSSGTESRIEAVIGAGMNLMSSLGGQVFRTHGRAFLIFFGLRGDGGGSARIAAHASVELRKLIPTESMIGFRVGMNTGLVIVGDSLGAPDPTGAVSRLAIALCMQAEPGEVLISKSTARLLRNTFLVASVGQISVIGRWMERIRLLFPSISPLIGQGRDRVFLGREQESQLFSDAWDKKKGGLLLIEGPAGIGKSRLIRWFAQHAQEKGGVVRMLECAPQYADTPFYPVVQLLRALIEHSGTQLDGYDRIQRYLDRIGSLSPVSVALFGHILSLPPNPEFPLPEVSVNILRELDADLILSLLRQRIRKGRLLMILDDLQWADPSSLSLFRRVLNDPEILQRAFIVFAVRPDAMPDWLQAISGLKRIQLHPLSQSESLLLIERLSSASKTLSGETIDRILAVSGGVPLFVEELTQALIEDPSLHTMAHLPETIQEVILGQLGRHHEVCLILQRAAVIGRSVAMDLFRALSPEPAVLLTLYMNRAAQSGFIVLDETPAGFSFGFRHALIHDVVYQSVSPSCLIDLHRAVADTLVDQFADRAALTPEVVAQHYERAGEWKKAIEWYEMAAQGMLKRASFLESGQQTRNALRLITHCPDTPARTNHEIRLLLFLGNILVELHGHGSPQAREIHHRALLLCHSQEFASEELFRALCSLCVSLIGGADIQGGRAVVASLAAITAKTDEPSFDFSYLYADSNLSFWEGHFTRALESMDASMGLYLTHQKAWEADYRLKDTILQVGVFRTWTLWFVGRWSEACSQMEQAIGLAGSIEQQGLLLSFACCLYRFLRLPDPVLALTDRILQATQQNQTVGWVPAERAFRGWVMAIRGDAAGIPLIQQGLTLSRDSHPVAEVVYLSLLAEAHLALANSSACREAVDSAMKFSKRSGTGFYDAELCRLLGEAAVLEQDLDSAREAFVKAITISHEQGAVALGLRASISLAKCARLMTPDVDVSHFITPFEGFLMAPGPTFPDILEARSLLMVSSVVA